MPRSEKRLVIVGAGAAGLLAANLLRHHRPLVMEREESLPNNHSAVLRFRSSIVGDVLGMPFQKVTVIKDVVPWRNAVADAHAYSWKTLGQYRSDRSIVRGKEVVERWIAPSDLISRMAEGLDIEYSRDWDFLRNFEVEGKVISTIPMPSLMAKLDYRPEPKPAFSFMRGVNIRCQIDSCQSYVSLAVPDPSFQFSRVSVTGDELIIEFSNIDDDSMIEDIEESVSDYITEALSLLGMSMVAIGEATVYQQQYAKIIPIDERQRRDFIYWASTVKGIAFSLGRFACWRPGLLMDDLVNDVRMIDSWIRSPSPLYDQGIHHGRPM
jgi:hypothetical protein